MPNIGFRILPMPARPTKKLVRALSTMVTAHLSDNMNRLYAGGAALRPMHRGGNLCGPALTVRAAPGDNLMVHKAIDIAAPGDVIVVDADGVLTQAIIGDIMSSLAEKRGVAGFVIYGAIRDSAEIASRRFPVYACGVTHRGPYKNGPGEINTTVAIDGMVVRPGDIICGDADGVVAVPLEHAEAVLALARVQLAKETAMLKAIAAGKADRRWVDETLRKLGCDF